MIPHMEVSGRTYALSRNWVVWEDAPGTDPLGSQGPGGRANRLGLSSLLLPTWVLGRPAMAVDETVTAASSWNTVQETTALTQLPVLCLQTFLSPSNISTKFVSMK